MIVDAGGGTIDVSAYQQSRKGKQPFEEISAAKCSSFSQSSNGISLTLLDRPVSWIGIRCRPREGAYQWFVFV